MSIVIIKGEVLFIVPDTCSLTTPPAPWQVPPFHAIHLRFFTITGPDWEEKGAKWVSRRVGERASE